MFSPPLSDHLALVAADPVVGHPVVAGLVATVGELGKRLGALEAENTSLREENADLRRQLGRHSGNSGQPPSQDGPSVPPRTRSQRRSQGRRPGGQPGHAGTTRLQSERVDAHEDHWLTRCGGCGAALPRSDAGSPAVRQVHDLPEPPPLEVTEHRAHAVCCPGCGTRTRAPFPADVAGPVQFGPRLEALAAYLRYVQHLPVGRLRDLLRARHGVVLSTGAVKALYRRAVRRLEVLRRHGRARPLRPLPEPTAGGDRPRDLQRPSTAQPRGNCRTGKGARLLREARDGAVHWADTTDGPVPESVRAQTAEAWDALLAPVLDHYESLPSPARGRRRGHNLALALWTLRDACLLFLADLAVPFTNNLAETARKRGQTLLDLLRRDPDEPWLDPVPP